MLIHRYIGVDLELTWRLVQQELPRLKQRAREIPEHKGGAAPTQD